MFFLGVPQSLVSCSFGRYPSQDWGTPLPGLGYPQARIGILPARTGVTPPPSPAPGQVTLQAVCLMQFPTGGLTCCTKKRAFQSKAKSLCLASPCSPLLVYDVSELEYEQGCRRLAPPPNGKEQIKKNYIRNVKTSCHLFSLSTTCEEMKLYGVLLRSQIPLAAKLFVRN